MICVNSGLHHDEFSGHKIHSLQIFLMGYDEIILPPEQWIWLRADISTGFHEKCWTTKGVKTKGSHQTPALPSELGVINIVSQICNETLQS